MEEQTMGNLESIITSYELVLKYDTKYSAWIVSSWSSKWTNGDITSTAFPRVSQLEK